MEIVLELLKEGGVSLFLYKDVSHQITANNIQQTAENDTKLPFIFSHISPHNTTSNQTEGFPNCPMAQDLSDHFMAKDLSDSPINQPPSSTSASSSAFASETNSALASEPNLPLPSSPKAKKQVDLLDFFSKIPSEKVHIRW